MQNELDYNEENYFLFAISVMLLAILCGKKKGHGHAHPTCQDSYCQLPIGYRKTSPVLYSSLF